jgi:hypothetical protein
MRHDMPGITGRVRRGLPLRARKSATLPHVNGMCTDSISRLGAARKREEASLFGRLLRCSGVVALMGALCACSPKTYVPELATGAYPSNLHTTDVADIQVFRRGTELEIVNSTAHSHANFDLWVNQRYVKRVELLPAGETIRVSLWDFFDEYGQRFYAGGLFRTYPATPVRLVEIQVGDEQLMLGLISIRAEEIRTIERQY